MPLPLSNMDKALAAMGDYPMTIDQVAEGAVMTLAATHSALRRLARTGAVTDFTVERADGRPKCRFYTKQKVEDQPKEPEASAIGSKMEPEFLSVREVAQILRVTTQTIYNMASEGEIATTRVGRAIRIPRSEIDRMTPKRAS